MKELMVLFIVIGVVVSCHVQRNGSSGDKKGSGYSRLYYQLHEGEIAIHLPLKITREKTIVSVGEVFAIRALYTDQITLYVKNSPMKVIMDSSWNIMMIDY